MVKKGSFHKKKITLDKIEQDLLSIERRLEKNRIDLDIVGEKLQFELRNLEEFKDRFGFVNQTIKGSCP